MNLVGANYLLFRFFAKSKDNPDIISGDRELSGRLERTLKTVTLEDLLEGEDRWDAARDLIIKSTEGDKKEKLLEALKHFTKISKLELKQEK